MVITLNKIEFSPAGLQVEIFNQQNKYLKTGFEEERK